TMVARSASSLTPYISSKSTTSRSLNPTLPSSMRLILEPDARIAYPASSRVIPLASRSLRSWEPRRMRRTVGPLPGCTEITPTPLVLPLRNPSAAPPVGGLLTHSHVRLALSSARALARYKGDDSACAPHARQTARRQTASHDRTLGGLASHIGGHERGP